MKLVHWWRLFTLVVSIAVSLSLTGCGGSEQAVEGEEEEAAAEEPQVQKIGQEAPAKKPEPKAQPAPQTGLTNFNANQQQAAPQSQLSQYEKQIEELRTEKTNLSQKVMKLEQDNRSLTTKLSETETLMMAEKIRADRAEEAARNAPAQSAVGQSNVAQSPVAQPISAKEEPKKEIAMAAGSYDDALKAFNARKYDVAAAGFQAIIDAGAKEDIVDNCKYWIGEAQFARSKYSDAMMSFQAVMKYKNSEKKGDAQFMIAQCYEKLGNKVKAKEGYEKVVKDYPMSKNVKRSKERWGKL
jgi:tol-pal system protein YbgF